MNNYAILTACQYYRDPSLGSLAGTNSDITLIKDALMESGLCEEAHISVVLNTDATKFAPSATDIAASIAEFSTQLKDTEIDTLFFYFTGHGYIKDKTLCLVPSDALANHSLGELPLKQVADMLEECFNAKCVVLIIDICQQERRVKGVGEIYYDYPKTAIFYSCLPNQSSYMLPAGQEGSVYTFHFAAVLRKHGRTFSMQEIEDEVSKRMREYCKEHSIKQTPCLAVMGETLNDFYFDPSVAIAKRRTLDGFSKPVNLDQSIWLTDAELATGEQTRFNTFTSTSIVKSFIDPDSSYWGIASVKGIGKTFLLQVKRTKLPKNVICFPYAKKPSKENNWAIAAVKFSDETLLQKNVTYQEVRFLWKFSLVCYVCHSWLFLQENSKRQNSEYSELVQRMSDDNSEGKLSDLLYMLLTDKGFSTFHTMVEYIITTDSWVSFIRKEYKDLARVGHLIVDAISQTSKNVLVLLLDKVDQAMRQPNSEHSGDCDNCSKRTAIQFCRNPHKSIEYCREDGNCPQRVACCYGCEIYSDIYAGTTARLSDSCLPLQNSHFNYWQRMQLALMEAVADIKLEFDSRIKILYTVRTEAYNYSGDVWGEHRTKVTGLACSLKYSREEYKKIYQECIAHQSKDLLFNPLLLGKPGREDEAFVGVKKICHPYVPNIAESVFDIIYRHSFDRTRDMQDYGQALTAKIDEIRACETESDRSVVVKTIIEKTAARLAYNTNTATLTAENSYYFEKVSIMPSYWAAPVNFENFISRIDRNLLFLDDMKRICLAVNQCTNCPEDKCKCCAHHPFSALERLGMLGHVTISENGFEYAVQEFLSAQDVTYFHDQDTLVMNDHTMYLVHPALTKSIEAIRKGRKIMHFCGFIIGRGIRVPQSSLRSILTDRQSLSADEFEHKYYKEIE